MRRGFFFIFCICLCILGVGMSRTAMDPADFAGIWYTPETQNPYLFQEGLIYPGTHPAGDEDSGSVTGAYVCCRDSVFLFVRGIDALEKEQELHLIFRDHGSFLCENPDGTGQVYFIRYVK